MANREPMQVRESFYFVVCAKLRAADACACRVVPRESIGRARIVLKKPASTYTATLV